MFNGAKVLGTVAGYWATSSWPTDQRHRPRVCAWVLLIYAPRGEWSRWAASYRTSSSYTVPHQPLFLTISSTVNHSSPFRRQLLLLNYVCKNHYSGKPRFMQVSCFFSHSFEFVDTSNQLYLVITCRRIICCNGEAIEIKIKLRYNICYKSL